MKYFLIVKHGKKKTREIEYSTLEDVLSVWTLNLLSGDIKQSIRISWNNND